MTKEIKALDFLGKELFVGDEIAFMELRYRHMERGKITKITFKMLFIEYTNYRDWDTNCKQTHNQVIKI